MLYEKPKPIAEIISEIIVEDNLEEGLKRARLMARFKDLLDASERDAISRLSYSNGILYCTLNSSIVRSSLFLKKKEILSRLRQGEFDSCLKNIVLR